MEETHEDEMSTTSPHAAPGHTSKAVSHLQMADALLGSLAQGLAVQCLKLLKVQLYSICRSSCCAQPGGRFCQSEPLWCSESNVAGGV